jgi:hypothetical protein
MKLLDHPLLRNFEGPARRTEIMSGMVSLPQAPGVYAWCFHQVPPGVPAAGCLSHGGSPMLYVGISPDGRSSPSSRQDLRSRIRHHLGGNAEGSTLRRTLGILLSGQSGFPLRRVGSGKRMTLTHLGEQWLDGWLDENALLFWRTTEQPWLLEEEIIASVSCPLNLRGNESHPFSRLLRDLRSAAFAEARLNAIAAEGNQSRNPEALRGDTTVPARRGNARE